MKKLILALVCLYPQAVKADACEELGLYAFHLSGCPQAALGVDTTTPLCKQEQWKHLAWMDKRCYKERFFDWKRACNKWDCPVPYEHIFVEPISGKTYVAPLNTEEMDQHYRSVRQALGQRIAKKRGRK